MDVSQLNEALNKVFAEENARIVFWNDPDQEFLEALPELELDDVNLLRLDEVGALEVKIKRGARGSCRPLLALLTN